MGVLIVLFNIPFSGLYAADEVITITTADDTGIDVRLFKAKGKQLLIGFSCDQGASIAEEKTAQALAADGVEVWMPDMLSAYMLPKARSSLTEIPTDDLIKIIEKAQETNKEIYLIASGPETELVLRVAHEWRKIHKNIPLGGGILMFPRLSKHTPEPGKKPEYQDAVGTTHFPILVLEGERTPNRWGIAHLTDALKKNGSPVYAKLIPNVRGFFYKREDHNASEDAVTAKMPSLIKSGLDYLSKADRGTKK